jgi:hypothetical protein
MNSVDLVLFLISLAGQTAAKVFGKGSGATGSTLVAEAAALGKAAYDYILQETGQPIDFSKIPNEDPIASSAAAPAAGLSPVPAGAESIAPKPALTLVAAAKPAAAADQASTSRCPFCGAAGVATGQICPACGKVHQ